MRDSSIGFPATSGGPLQARYLNKKQYRLLNIAAGPSLARERSIVEHPSVDPEQAAARGYQDGRLTFLEPFRQRAAVHRIHALSFRCVHFHDEGMGEGLL